MNDVEKSAVLVDEVAAFKAYAKTQLAMDPPKPVQIWIAGRVPLLAQIAELRAEVEQLRNALMKACGDDADAVQDCIDAVTDKSEAL